MNDEITKAIEYFERAITLYKQVHKDWPHPVFLLELAECLVGLALVQYKSTPVEANILLLEAEQLLAKTRKIDAGLCILHEEAYETEWELRKMLLRAKLRKQSSRPGSQPKKSSMRQIG